MPIFEYRCRSCHKKTTVLVMSRARASEVRCRYCDSTDVEKLWSRFSSPKSEDARLDAMADPSGMAGLDENDPRSVAKFMKKMGQEMGEDVGDLEQAMEEEMAGGGAGGDDGDGGMGGMGPGSDDL
jgi:putative FmdB family regulatory protein